VPPGISNLKLGDVVYFAAGSGQRPEHVAIVTSTNQATNVASPIEVPHTGAFVQRSSMTATIGSSYGGSLVYIGALQPAT
jgi:cell wall-associated NlpC family hydrolase